MLSLFVIGCILPHDSPFLSSQDISVSPFTVVLQLTNIPGASHIVNAVILTAVLSAGVSAIYSSSRLLMSISADNQIPQLFAKVNSRGIPFNSILFSTILSIIFFSFRILGPHVYKYLIGCSSIGALLAYIGILIAHIRFRYAFIKQGHALNELVYQANFFPYGQIFSLILIALVIFFSGY